MQAEVEFAQVVVTTTQPITPVVVDPVWTPTAVITVVTIVIGLITASLIPSIIALVNSIKAKTVAEAATVGVKEVKTDAEDAKAKAHVATCEAKTNTEKIEGLQKQNQQQAEQITEINRAMPLKDKS